MAEGRPKSDTNVVTALMSRLAPDVLGLGYVSAGKEPRLPYCTLGPCAQH
jgi:hypothetical protein